LAGLLFGLLHHAHSVYPAKPLFAYYLGKLHVQFSISHTLKVQGGNSFVYSVQDAREVPQHHETGYRSTPRRNRGATPLKFRHEAVIEAKGRAGADAKL